MSTAALGPRKSKQYEIRFAAIDSEPPVLQYASISPRSRKLVSKTE